MNQQHPSSHNDLEVRCCILLPPSSLRGRTQTFTITCYCCWCCCLLLWTSSDQLLLLDAAAGGGHVVMLLFLLLQGAADIAQGTCGQQGRAGQVRSQSELGGGGQQYQLVEGPPQ